MCFEGHYEAKVLQITKELNFNVLLILRFRAAETDVDEPQLVVEML